MKLTEPMLAARKLQLCEIRYPILASAKIDAVRMVIAEGSKVRSRKLEPIPNRYLNRYMEALKADGLDGECCVGKPNAKNAFRHTQSELSSADGEPDFRFYVFDDYTHGERPFAERLLLASERVARLNAKGFDRIEVLPHMLIENEAALLQYEARVLALGFEGLILRSPKSAYKCGRSTIIEHGMLKLKRFVDDEALVIGMEEEMENTNAAGRSNVGRTKRSKAKAGMEPKGRMGALVCVTRKGIVFNVGSGFDDEARKWYWAHRKEVIKNPWYWKQYEALCKMSEGARYKWYDANLPRLSSNAKFWVKFKSFPIGVKDKPRHPIYLGPRATWDLPKQGEQKWTAT